MKNMEFRKWTGISLLAIISLMFSILVSQSLAGETAKADENIIRAGREKARQMGFNPIPVYVDEKGEIIIVSGTQFSIRNGKWVLDNGDMLINAGDRPLPIAGGSVLKKGEYGVVKNYKLKKFQDNLISDLDKEKQESSQETDKYNKQNSK